MTTVISRRGEHDRPSLLQYATMYISKTSQCDVLDETNYSVLLNTDVFLSAYTSCKIVR